jgi:putative transposase
VRVLATVADRRGEVIERVSNPRPLEAALKELRHLSRRKSRRSKGSRRYSETTQQMSRLHRRVADIRCYHIHRLTTRLAKTHGEIVVEGLDAAGMLRQKGLTGARARRRGLSDSALGEPRRQLDYKPVGTDHNSPLPTAGSHHRKPAMPADVCRTSGGLNTGPAAPLRGVAGSSINATTTRRSTSRATRTPAQSRVASSAQSGPPLSVEPTLRPGLAGQVAMKRGRELAPGPGNNPETGYLPDERSQAITRGATAQ